MSSLFLLPNPLNFSQIGRIASKSVPFSVPLSARQVFPAASLSRRLQQFLNAVIATLRVKFTV